MIDGGIYEHEGSYLHGSGRVPDYGLPGDSRNPPRPARQWEASESGALAEAIQQTFAGLRKTRRSLEIWRAVAIAAIVLAVVLAVVNWRALS